MATGSPPIRVSKISDKLWARSELTKSVRQPSSAMRTAVAEAMLDLPTPPLPV